MKKNSKIVEYQVWALGYNDTNFATDYEQMLQVFSKEQDAIDYVNSIDTFSFMENLPEFTSKVEVRIECVTFTVIDEDVEAVYSVFFDL